MSSSSSSDGTVMSSKTSAGVAYSFTTEDTQSNSKSDWTDGTPVDPVRTTTAVRPAHPTRSQGQADIRRHRSRSNYARGGGGGYDESDLPSSLGVSLASVLCVICFSPISLLAVCASLTSHVLWCCNKKRSAQRLALWAHKLAFVSLYLGFIFFTLLGLFLLSLYVWSTFIKND